MTTDNRECAARDRMDVELPHRGMLPTLAAGMLEAVLT